MAMKIKLPYHNDEKTFIEVEVSLIVIVAGCLALMAWWLFY